MPPAVEVELKAGATRLALNYATSRSHSMPEIRHFVRKT